MNNGMDTKTYKNTKQRLKTIMKTRDKFWCNRYKYYKDKLNTLTS